MNIPSEYPVGGYKINVAFTPDLMEEHNALGWYSPNKSATQLQPPIKNEVANQNIEEAFCHEVIHSWTDKLDYPQLYRNEKFTNDMALVLYQFLKAMGVF